MRRVEDSELLPPPSSLVSEIEPVPIPVPCVPGGRGREARQEEARGHIFRKYNQWEEEVTTTTTTTTITMSTQLIPPLGSAH